MECPVTPVILIFSFPGTTDLPKLIAAPLSNNAITRVPPNVTSTVGRPQESNVKSVKNRQEGAWGAQNP